MRVGITLATAGILAVGIATAAVAGVGTAGGQVLQDSFGPRAAAMAGAFAAQSGGLDSVGFNPAGLAGLEKVDIQFMHAAGVENMGTEWFAAGVPVPSLANLAAQILYRGQPAIDNGVAGEGGVESKELFFGISLARPIAAGISAGINAKMLSLTLGPANASALVFDLGAQYQLLENTRLGVSVRNLGESVKFHETADPLPTVATVAGLWTPFLEGTHKVNLEADADYQTTEQNRVARAGMEYWFKNLLAMRLGYAYSATRSVGGFSAGVGFRFKLTVGVNMNLDYSLQPQSWEDADFELVNRIGLGINF
ncbi:MAG: PorV/PorQ family protein [Candidatus Firestonebacteria bacterium]|nr:PorV/PorQ family protein [Candidatus Firestonebacteria bacterium]